MSAGEIVALIAVAVSVSAAILAGLLWIIRAVIAMQNTLKPNGGHSVKDQLNRIERDVSEVRHKVDDHITWHMSQ
jgi:hypothetical protein